MTYSTIVKKKIKCILCERKLRNKSELMIHYQVKHKMFKEEITEKYISVCGLGNYGYDT